MTDEGEDDGTDEFDLEEWKRKNEENRKERLEKATYDWVETVRDAGELYRDLDDKEAVSDKLDLSDETIQEALTVYDLIFDHPVDNISARTAIGGRAYFSLERSVDDSLEDSDEEKIKEVVREFVGAVYIQNDLDEHEVGDPPENSTPPSNVDLTELTEMLSDGFASQILGMPDLYGISSIPDGILDTQSTQIAKAVQPMIDRRNRFVTSLAEDVIAQQQEMMEWVLSSKSQSFIRNIQLQQEMLNKSMANSIVDLDFPEPLISDIVNLQPHLGAIAGANLERKSTRTSSPSTTADTEPIESDLPEEYEVDSDTSITFTGPTNPGLVLEVSIEITRTILSSEEVRSWFRYLSKRKQMRVVQLTLTTIVLIFTQNAAWTSLALCSSDMVRQMVLEDIER